MVFFELESKPSGVGVVVQFLKNSLYLIMSTADKQS